eukprot:scaffold17490_cov19-Tisochrysis_lutea.AAC.2
MVPGRLTVKDGPKVPCMKPHNDLNCAGKDLRVRQKHVLIDLMKPGCPCDHECRHGMTIKLVNDMRYPPSMWSMPSGSLGVHAAYCTADRQSCLNVLPSQGAPSTNGGM